MQTQTYRALIVDDEPDARNALRLLVGRFCPHLAICAEADSVTDALIAIQQFRPEVIFLDVTLKQGSGFDILDVYPRPEFKVIFTTAHDHFAVKAFKYGALHYLLKPVDPQELIDASSRLGDPQQHWPSYKMVNQSVLAEQAGVLFLQSAQGYVVIRPEEIAYVKADEGYATVVLNSDEKIFVSHSLKDLSALLPESGFLYPHQSYIVSLLAVRKLYRSEGLSLILKDKTEIPISRRNRDMVLRALSPSK